MEQSFSLSLSRENVIVVGVTTALIALFVSLFLLPMFFKQKALDNDIIALKAEVEEFNQLKMLHETLDRKLATEAGASLPPDIVHQSLISKDAGRIMEILQNTVKAAGSKIISIKPEIVSQNAESQILRLNTSISGEIDSFRVLLMRLLQFSYVRNIETLTIKAAEQELHLELLFTVEVQ
ncbi:MAG: hypothetical protein KAJ60_06430 [Desulfobulbaceae bacterium]|nr:hypothetical protein [Desulfobulbaceae bacterium]MCK5340692.1 hypothetical protein [Desulfobulbaceae bacterium]MCK5403866.1 hypothetical protein [Desulfobulbaceae bacterium]